MDDLDALFCGLRRELVGGLLNQRLVVMHFDVDLDVFVDAIYEFDLTQLLGS